MSDIEDEIRQRAHALSVLEDDTEELVGDRRRAGLQERYDGDLVGSPDELDIAAQVSAETGTPSTGLLHKVSLRERAWEQAGKLAPYVRVNPQSANKGTLGGQQRVFLNGPAIQVAWWAADTDTETTAVTITLAPVEQVLTTIQASKTFRPIGIIQFGTRGFSVKAEVDIVTGTQFTVNASSVILQVGFDSSTAGDPASDNMLLAGMLSFLPTTRPTIVTRTKYLDNPGAGVTSLIPVPPFANNAIFWRDPLGEAVTLKFLDKGGDILYTFVLAGGSVMATPIAIAGDVVNIAVTDTGGAGIVRGRMIFGLNL